MTCRKEFCHIELGVKANLLSQPSQVLDALETTLIQEWDTVPVKPLSHLVFRA